MTTDQNVPELTVSNRKVMAKACFPNGNVSMDDHNDVILCHRLARRTKNAPEHMPKRLQRKYNRIHGK